MRPVQRVVAFLWIVSIAAMVFLLWSYLPAGLGGGSSELRILYAGDTAGYLEPCG